MSYTERGYVNMVCSFRTHELQTLLSSFNYDISGEQSELSRRAIDLLRNRPFPNGFDYHMYMFKISEIYQAMHQIHVSPNNGMMHTQPRMLNIQNRALIGQQHRRYQQQSINIPRPGLPQVIPTMQRRQYESRITEMAPSASNNSIQHGNHMANNYNVVLQQPTIQQNTMGTQNLLQHDMNAQGSGNSIPSNSSLPSVNNIKIKKLPFYEVIAEVIKPTILFGQEVCTLPNFSIPCKYYDNYNI